MFALSIANLFRHFPSQFFTWKRKIPNTLSVYVSDVIVRNESCSMASYANENFWTRLSKNKVLGTSLMAHTCSVVFFLFRAAALFRADVLYLYKQYELITTGRKWNNEMCEKTFLFRLAERRSRQMKRCVTSNSKGIKGRLGMKWSVTR